MGMSKNQLDLQIQAAGQKAIAQLEQNMKHLDAMLRAVDHNMRNSHMSLMGNIQQITLRLNFIIDELKSDLNEEDLQKFEERFKASAGRQQEEAQKRVEEMKKNVKES